MTAAQTSGISSHIPNAARHHAAFSRVLFWLVGMLAGSCLAVGAAALVVGMAHGLARWTLLPPAEIAIVGALLVCLFACAMMSLRLYRELAELRKAIRHSASYLCEILDRMTWIEGLLEQSQEPDRVSHQALSQR